MKQQIKNSASMMHGHTAGGKSTPVYECWQQMKARCLNSKHPRYSSYGGRGIKVCDKWLSFSGFYDDMGDKPVGKSLDRIDNNGDYRPENCCWSSPLKQANNKRDTNHYLFNGKMQTLRQIMVDAGTTVSHSAVSRRLTYGWDIRDAVILPLQKKGRGRKHICKPT